MATGGMRHTQSNNDWFHDFSVSETQTHHRGFTIYRITSVIYPRTRPETLSCVTVWKRYSEVKRLYKVIGQRLRQDPQLRHARAECPASPNRRIYVRRFDPSVIEKRRQFIAQLLEFIGSHSQLYSCSHFATFLQGGHSPTQEQSPASDKERSVEEDSCNGQKSSTSSESVSLATVTPTIPSSQPVNEQAGGDEDSYRPQFSSDYFVEAAEQFNEAVKLEVNDQYASAFDMYKLGIGILLRGIKTDQDDIRRRLAKEKAAKYLARSESLHDHFIKPAQVVMDDSSNAGNNTTSTSSRYTPLAARELPLGQLAKYKVVKVLSENVLSVQEVTTKRYYVIKSIDRPHAEGDGDEQLPVEQLLAQNPVPYMVQLVAYFVTDFVIFVLLQPVSGGNLVDYVRNYVPVTEVDSTEDDEELESNTTEERADAPPTRSDTIYDSGYVEVTPFEQPAEPPCEDAQAAYEHLTSDIEVLDILSSSQRLLESVEKTLKQSMAIDSCPEAQLMTRQRIPQPPQLCILPEACIRQWAKELIMAIHGLHLQNIIVGDLRPKANLLLGKVGQLLITYSYWRNHWSAYSLDEVALEEGYVAPERPLQFESDWYTVGVILFELLTGQRFSKCHPGGICYYFELQFESEPVREQELSPEAISLVTGLIVENPKYRLGFDGICAHPFFEETDWTEMQRKGISELTTCTY